MFAGPNLEVGVYIEEGAYETMGQTVVHPQE